MFVYAQLAVGLLQLVNTILDIVTRDKLIQSGYDKAVAEQSTAILRKTAAGKAIMDKVDAMGDKDVDDALRGLEP